MEPEPTAPSAWRAFRSDPQRQTAVAYVLWIVLAGVIWNVVFDRVLVLAGRRYVHAASQADEGGRPPVLVDPWMREARSRGARLAALVTVPVMVVGVIAIRFASRRNTSHRRLSRGT